jgi:hypothetical protein
MPGDACFRGAATAGAVPAALAGTAGNPSDERLAVRGRIVGGEMLGGPGPEWLVVPEAAGHGSFVRPPDLCLPVSAAS